jgi:hypothetical protein
MRWTAKSNIVRPALIAAFACGAILFGGSWPGSAARAGAITDASPAPQNGADTFNLDQDPSGPAIRFSLSPEDPDSSGTAVNPADSQQSNAPWIGQDPNSPDWFGKRDDILSASPSGSGGSVSGSSVGLETPAIRDPLSVNTGTDQFQTDPSSAPADDNLGDTLTRIVVGFFQGLGYAKTAFVLIPILILAAFIGLTHVAKVLRVSQGLDPVKGQHRWGIRRSGAFGPVDESNDNSKRPRRKKNVA